jgi:hypothetical protein
MKYIENYSPLVLQKISTYAEIYGDPEAFSSAIIVDEVGNQIGGVLPVFYESGIEQDGNGLFGNIWGLFKPFIMPLIKSGTKATAESVLNSAGGYINDIVAGADWRKAGQDRLMNTRDELASKFVNKVKRMHGSGIKRRLEFDDISDSLSDKPAAKVQRILEEIEQKNDKRQGPEKKLFSILPPSETHGRDLRLKKRVVKKVFRNARASTIAKRKLVKRRVTKKKKKKVQKGKGFDCWL